MKRATPSFARQVIMWKSVYPDRAPAGSILLQFPIATNHPNHASISINFNVEFSDYCALLAENVTKLFNISAVAKYWSVLTEPPQKHATRFSEFSPVPTCAVFLIAIDSA